MAVCSSDNQIRALAFRRPNELFRHPLFSTATEEYPSRNIMLA
jgi:hypothetical protein